MNFSVRRNLKALAISFCFLQLPGFLLMSRSPRASAHHNFILLPSTTRFFTVSVTAQKQPEKVVRKEILEHLKTDAVWKEAIELDDNGNAKNLVAVPIRLSRNKKPELYIQGRYSKICGAANCIGWIFRRTRNGYEQLLETGSVQRVIPQRTFTEGYRDLMTSKHGSAWESDLTLYQFDGKQYQRVACFHRTYQYLDEKGQFHELKQPRITRKRCS